MKLHYEFAQSSNYEILVKITDRWHRNIIERHLVDFHIGVYIVS